MGVVSSLTLSTPPDTAGMSDTPAQLKHCQVSILPLEMALLPDFE